MQQDLARPADYLQVIHTHEETQQSCTSAMALPKLSVDPEGICCTSMYNNIPSVGPGPAWSPPQTEVFIEAHCFDGRIGDTLHTCRALSEQRNIQIPRHGLSSCSVEESRGPWSLLIISATTGWACAFHATGIGHTNTTEASSWTFFDV